MGETDHPLKRLVELAGADIAAWLLQQAVVQVQPMPSNLTLPVSALDADFVLQVTLVDGQEVILHLEFQGPGSHRPVPMRMLEYDTRLVVHHPGRLFQSVVLYLAGAGAHDTGQHAVYGLDGQPQLRWQYQVVHVWQLSGEALLTLNRPGLLPLLGQTRLQNPVATMVAAVTQIGQQTAGEQRDRLLSELLLLCSDTEVATMLEQLIRQDYGLPETPMMRKLREQGWQEGREVGREVGREEGREEGLEYIVLRQLQRRCGALDATFVAQVQGLRAAQMLELAEALLDFQGVGDLQTWLETVRPTAERNPGESVM